MISNHIEIMFKITKISVKIMSAVNIKENFVKIMWINGDVTHGERFFYVNLILVKTREI